MPLYKIFQEKNFTQNFVTIGHFLKDNKTGRIKSLPL